MGKSVLKILSCSAVIPKCITSFHNASSWRKWCNWNSSKMGMSTSRTLKIDLATIGYPNEHCQAQRYSILTLIAQHSNSAIEVSKMFSEVLNSIFLQCSVLFNIKRLNILNESGKTLMIAFKYFKKYRNSWWHRECFSTPVEICDLFSSSIVPIIHHNPTHQFHFLFG